MSAHRIILALENEAKSNPRQEDREYTLSVLLLNGERLSGKPHSVDNANYMKLDSEPMNPAGELETIYIPYTAILTVTPTWL